MALPIDLWLIHPETEMCDAFSARFEGMPNVSVLQSRFEDLPPHDCFVTAGNSFGIMNAGIDAAVIQFHGKDLMRRIQHRILDEYLGEQPIGTSMIEPTGNSMYPFVAHSPTMRVPGCINGTDKVYAATWASLVAVYRHKAAKNAEQSTEQLAIQKTTQKTNHKDDSKTTENRSIEVVVFPAMGAGFGGVPFSEVARQMAAAYRHYLSPPHRMNWDMVAARQRTIHYDGRKRVSS